MVSRSHGALRPPTALGALLALLLLGATGVQGAWEAGAQPGLNLQGRRRGFGGDAGRHLSADDAAAAPAADADEFEQDADLCPNIKEYGTIQDTANLDSAVYQLVWGANGVIFAVTEGKAGQPSKLWRSANSGATWTDLTDQLTAAKEAHPTNKNELGAFDISVQTVYVHGTNKQKVIVQGASIWYWVTSNGGSTWKAIESPGGTYGYLHDIKMHPSSSDWMLVMATRSGDSCDDYVHSGNCPADLFFTQNFGNKWQNLTDNADGDIAGFVDYDWAVNVHTEHTVAEEMLPNKAIMATVYTDIEAARSPDSAWTHDVTFVYSDNFFKHKDKKSETLVHCAHSFELVAGVVYLARPNTCPVDLDGSKMNYKHADMLDGISLYVSSDQGKSFERACLPTPLHDYGYSMIETHDGQGAFVTANHNNNVGDVPYYDWTITNIYSAGPHPAVFTLTLANGFSKTADTFPDFHPVAGIPGIVIANQEVSKNPDEPFYVRGEARQDTEAATVISINGGGSWMPLIASPNKNDYYYPQCNRCSQVDDAHCYMFLHGSSSWKSWYASPAIPAIYSHESAPGVIMATGNTGPWGTGLSSDPEELCTFISTDGGFSWTDVAPHAGIYEFGDAGAVIVLAQHGVHGPTDHIWFSVDGGVCFDKLPLKTALNIDNISVDPEGTGTVFIVHGTECSQEDDPLCTQVGKGDYAGDPAGVLFSIDVTKLKNSKTDPTHVSGFPDGMCKPADYVLWTPKDIWGDFCLLGRNIRVERRAIEDYEQWNNNPKKCQNGEAYIRKPMQESTQECPCSDTDLECDYGYFREPSPMSPGEKKRCLEIENAIPICEAIDHDGYAISDSHKRLIHGDVCENVGAVLTDTDGKGHWLQPKKHKTKQPPNATLRWNDAGYIGPGKGGHGSGSHHGWLWTMLVAGVGTGGLAVWWTRYAGHGTKAAVMDVVAPAASLVMAPVMWVASKVGLGGSRRGAGYSSMEDNPTYDPI